MSFLITGSNLRSLLKSVVPQNLTTRSQIIDAIDAVIELDHTYDFVTVEELVQGISQVIAEENDRAIRVTAEEAIKVATTPLYIKIRGLEIENTILRDADRSRGNELTVGIVSGSLAGIAGFIGGMTLGVMLAK